MEQKLDIHKLPEEKRAELAARARTQTVEKYHAPASLFEQAERMVEAGHVLLTGRNHGSVWSNGWMAVGSDYCAHCRDAFQPVLCAHKLAVWYADLLARHMPKPEQGHKPDIGSGQAETGTMRLGRTGGYSGRPLSRRRLRVKGKKSDGKHCPRCGGWLTAAGGCNLCGGA